MKGSFICPHCKTINACSCKGCKDAIKEGEYVSSWTDDGELIICGKCNKQFSLDQAADEEYKNYRNPGYGNPDYSNTKNL